MAYLASLRRVSVRCGIRRPAQYTGSTRPTSILAQASAVRLMPSTCLSFGTPSGLLRSVHSSTIDPANIVALVFLLTRCSTTSDLAGRLRNQVAETRQQAAVTEALMLSATSLQGVNSGDKLLWTVVHQLAAMLRVEALIRLPRTGTLTKVAAAYPPDGFLCSPPILPWRSLPGVATG